MSEIASVTSFYEYSHILIFIACIYFILSTVIYVKVAVKIIDAIIRGIVYFFRNIVWDHIVYAAKFIWKHVFEPFGLFVKKIAIDVYNFFKEVVLELIDVGKKIFGIGKKVVIEAGHIGKNAYNVVKEISINTYNLGEDIVKTIIDVGKGIFNFIKTQVLKIYYILRNIFENIIDFFKDVGKFFTGIFDIFFKLF